ncbi:MAG: serine hydrolase domain-containing protein [Saprospiraceae bacterium]
MYYKYLISLTFLFSFSTFVFCQIANPLKSTFQKDAKELIEYAMAEIGSVPGIAISVVKQGETIYEGGFGHADLGKQLKMDEHSSFYIASCTKAFTALLAGLLDQEGVISLNASLSDFFPNISFDPNIKAQEVTIKSLLTHTAGISNDPIGFRVAYSGDHTQEQLVSLLVHTQPNRVGKGNYSYTNLGYNIYAIIVQEVTGKSWQALLEEKVFKPLGMKHTTAYVSKATQEGWPMALPYLGLKKGEIEPVYLLKKDNTMQSAGGLITTAADLSRWMKMQIQLGQLEGKQVFPKSIVKAAQSAQVACEEKRGDFEAAGYGYGWLVGQLQGEKAVWHSGGFPGYLSLMSFLPAQEMGVSVLINDGIAGFPLMYLLASFSYDCLLEKENVLADYKKKVDELASMVHKRQEQRMAELAERAKREWQLSHSFAHYSGTYENDAYGTITIKGDSEKMEVSMGNMHCVATPFTKENTVRVELVPGSGEVLAFQIEGDKVVGLTNGGDLFKKIK